jgi:GNAT superfamily N-acetyltransferase
MAPPGRYYAACTAQGERLSRHGGWADVGNLRVVPGRRRQGVGSWLLGRAADWLGLAQVSRLLDYAWLEGTDPGGQSYDDYRAFLPAVGFRELTRTACGWTQESQECWTQESQE